MPDAVYLSISLFLAVIAVVVGAYAARLHRRETARQNLSDAVMAMISDGVVTLGADGSVKCLNAAAKAMFGREVSGRKLADLLRGFPGIGEALAQIEYRADAVRADGSIFPVTVTLLALSDRSETVLIVRDLSRIRPGATEEEQRFKQSQYFARIGTWDWRIDTDELYWSDAIYGMFGYKPGEVTPTYSLFCDAVHPDDKEHVRAGEIRCIETGENHDEEYRVVWPDGTIRWLRETGNVTKNEAGQTIKMMGVVRDITEERAETDQIRDLAFHDPLTRLPNRIIFEDRLRKAMDRAKRNKKQVAVVFIDLDGFKQINDGLGHVAGDRILINTGQRLINSVRASDTVARIGGDEFTVILEDLETDAEVHGIADKILGAIAAPMELGDGSYRVGASLGIAIYPEHARTLDTLIHIADQAMYAAKAEGTNLYHIGWEMAD
ncbi:MAG: diguanylate cyclase [Thalassospira sp.]|uniref:diguanylate cyclase domain-containing protein n=1 Tax=Thalassospira sp. TaxID=1912094 RepID=UPI001B206D7E|nr:diguanylate cyclase [Thalassospira sp.]MBO6579301.1 diguanylate cyclase [Thalassospira sp.]MBO6819258.1 diguanylate cyclase [Thalassospira sp.]MBO6889711.1 diguanylate cyclase [Thalassospira sp.]